MLNEYLVDWDSVARGWNWYDLTKITAYGVPGAKEAAIKEKERRMGTGVKGSEQVETAASIMRREAAALRAKAHSIRKLANDRYDEFEDGKNRADAMNAEARKLEDAAHLIEPVPPVNETYAGPDNAVGRESVVTREYVERKVPRYGGEPHVDFRVRANEVYDGKTPTHCIKISGTDDGGHALWSFIVTKDDLPSGYIMDHEFNERLARLVNPSTRLGSFPSPDAAAVAQEEWAHTARPAHILLTARDDRGFVIRQGTITEEEIEDGYLSPLHTTLHGSPQHVIWRRLRKVAGLE